MKFNKKLTAIVASVAVSAFAMLSMAGPASAANEAATASLKMDPLSGSLYKDAFKPVNWQVQTNVTVPAGSTTIEPMKVADLQNPNGQLTFNPDPKMPVCPDNKIGPGLVSVPVEQAIAACPKSIIGNGLAKFALGQFTAASRDGVILVFNGGKQTSGSLKGQPRIKIYAYSYDTGVGLYTEGALSKTGQLYFDIPPLTADSSVTSLNISIPGKTTDLFVASKNITVTLPPGQDKNYAQAKCTTNSWPFKATFQLGDRDTAGQPSGPTTTLVSDTTTPCSGATGAAKFGALKIKGPASVKAGKKGTYKVTVKNAGTATAKGGKLAVSGKGVKGKASFGNLAAGASKTVTVKVKFTKKGKFKAKFKASAGKASKTATKSVKVK